MADSIKDKERKKMAEFLQLQAQMEKDKDDPKLKARFADIIAALLSLSFLRSKFGEKSQIADKTVETQKNSLNNEGQLDAFIENTDKKKLGEMVRKNTLAEHFAEHLTKSAKNDDKQWYKNGGEQNDPDEKKNNDIFIRDISNSVDSLESCGVSSKLLKDAKKVEKWSKLAATGNKAAIAQKLSVMFAARARAAEYLHDYAPDNGVGKDLWLDSSKEKVAATKDFISQLDNELIRMGAVAHDYAPKYDFDGKGKKSFHYENTKSRPVGPNEYHPVIVISKEEKLENYNFAKGLLDARIKLSPSEVGAVKYRDFVEYNRVGRSNSAEYNKMVRSTDNMIKSLKEFGEGHPDKSSGQLWAEKVSALMKARKDSVKYLAKKRLDAGIYPGNSEAWRKYRPSDKIERKRYTAAISIVQSIDEELARMGVCPHGTKLNYRIKLKNGRVGLLTTTVMARGNYNKKPSSVINNDLATANEIIAGAAEKKKKAEEAKKGKAGKDEQLTEAQIEKLIDHAAKLYADKDCKDKAKDFHTVEDREKARSDIMNKMKKDEEFGQFIRDTIDSYSDKENKFDYSDKENKFDAMKDYLDLQSEVIKEKFENYKQNKKLIKEKAIRELDNILLRENKDPDSVEKLVEVAAKIYAAKESIENAGKYKDENDMKAKREQKVQSLLSNNDFKEFVHKQLKENNDNIGKAASTFRNKDFTMIQEYKEFVKEKERERAETQKFMSDKRIQRLQKELEEKNKGGVGKLTREELIEYTAKILAANEVRLEREALKAKSGSPLPTYKEENRFDELWEKKKEESVLKEFVDKTIKSLTARGMLNEKLLDNAAAELPREVNRLWIDNFLKNYELQQESPLELNVNHKEQMINTADSLAMRRQAIVDTMATKQDPNNKKDAVKYAAIIAAAEKIKKEKPETMDKYEYFKMWYDEVKILMKNKAFKNFVNDEISKQKGDSERDKIKNFINNLTDKNGKSMLDGFDEYNKAQQQAQAQANQAPANQAPVGQAPVVQAPVGQVPVGQVQPVAQAQPGAHVQPGAQAQNGAVGPVLDPAGYRIKVIDEIKKAEGKNASLTETQVETFFIKLVYADMFDTMSDEPALKGQKYEDYTKQDSIDGAKNAEPFKGFFNEKKAKWTNDYTKLMKEQMLENNGHKLIMEFHDYKNRLDNNMQQQQQFINSKSNEANNHQQMLPGQAK